MTATQKRESLQHLSNDQLVARLSRLAQQRGGLVAELVAHIAEMDARKLYREYACSSCFAYVTKRLHLSEAAAYKHIHGGRIARKFPIIFTMLEAADTHLSNVLLVAPHLTQDNHQELLEAIRHKSKRDVELLVAQRFPKAPAPERIRRLPVRKSKSERAAATAASEAETSPSMPLRASASSGPPAMGTKTNMDKVQPLSVARFKVEFTADQELYDDIEKAKALLGPALPRGELSQLFALAMRNFVEGLEKKKYAKTSRPRASASNTTASVAASSSRRIPNQVKREVEARDGGRCTFTDERGNRCGERWGLEFHHAQVPFAHNGPPTTSNLTLHCRPHNLLMAEREFGSEFMEKKRAVGK